MGKLMVGLLGLAALVFVGALAWALLAPVVAWGVRRLTGASRSIDRSLGGGGRQDS